MVVPSGRDVSPGSGDAAQTCIRIHNNPSCAYHFVATDIFSCRNAIVGSQRKRFHRYPATPPRDGAARQYLSMAAPCTRRATSGVMRASSWPSALRCGELSCFLARRLRHESGIDVLAFGRPYRFFDASRHGAPGGGQACRRSAHDGIDLCSPIEAQTEAWRGPAAFAASGFDSARHAPWRRPGGSRRTCFAGYPSPRAAERMHRSHMRDEPRFARRLERCATSDVASHHAPQGLRRRPIAMNTYAEWSAAGGGQLSCPPSLPRVARAAQRGAPARTSGSMHAQATVVARSRHLPDLSA